MRSLEEMLEDLRIRGWRVGVHNDYRLNGEDMTFWLFTHSATARFVKGEGKTDKEVLHSILLQLQDIYGPLPLYLQIKA